MWPRKLQPKSSQSPEAQTKIQTANKPQQWSSSHELLKEDSLFKNGTSQAKVMGIGESLCLRGSEDTLDKE